MSEISAVSLRKSEAATRESSLSKLRKLASSGDFAKRMISTIEVSLTTGDAVDDVMEYIETAL
jgi:hypothetical protein